MATAGLVGPVQPTNTPDPDMFGGLLNFINANRQGLGRAARYGPAALTAVGDLSQGDVGGAIGAGAGAYGMGMLTQKLAASIPANNLPGMIAKGALYAGGGLLGSSLGSQLGSVVQKGLGQLVGGTQAAVQDVASTVASSQREGGKTALGEPAVGALSSGQQAYLDALRQLGVNMPAEAAERSFQVTNKMKDRDVARQMQLNQQLAGLTAQLQRNLGGMQLASQGMGIGGQLTNTMLTSNPYQASVLNTGAVRGPLG